MADATVHNAESAPDNEEGPIAYAIEPIVSIQSVASVAVHTIELDEDEGVISVE